MKMKKLLYTTSLIVLLFAQVGCSDFLEQQPGSQISIGEQLATREGMLEAVTGMYSMLESTLRQEQYTVYADLQGGNLKFSPTASGSNRGELSVPANVQQLYNFNDTALESQMESFYDNSYAAISAANLLLEYIDTVDYLSATERDAIAAEALSVRALMHFALLQVYAQDSNYPENMPGIVYKTETLQEELDYAPRLGLQETYTAIAADLEQALSLFPDAPVLEGPAYSYFRSMSAEALLARVYLAQGAWENAFTHATQVIATSGVTLTPNESYLEAWEAPLQPVSEILLELAVPVDADGAIGGSRAAQYGYSSANTYADYVATQDLLDLYAPEDIRGALFVEQELATLENEQLVNRPYYFTGKFQGNPGNPLLRLSEQYLIAAEAAYQLNNTDAALSNLNAIRERAGLQPLVQTENLEEELFLERRRELAFENQLFFDLKRTGRDVHRNDGCLSTTCSLDYPSNFFVLPIPQSNINLNANLIQNEGY